MKIIIDAEIFTTQQRGGISRHFSNLIRSYKSKADLKTYLNSFFHTNLHLKEERIGKFLPYKFLKIIKLFLLLRRFFPFKADIIHHSYYPRNIRKGRIPVVTNAYDMIPESGMNKLISRTIIKSKFNAFRKSDAIICISNFTKNSLIKYYPEFKHKTHVIHLGLPEDWEYKIQSNHPTPKWLDQDNNLRNITFIGNRFEYKNAQILIKAIQQIKDINLIFIGGELPSNAEKNLINKLKLNQRVSFIQANDIELIATIKKSYSICIPSKIEGFSLPLIEALYLDVPIIASNIEVHKEVAGNFAYFLDPNDHNEWYRFLRDNEIKKPSEILGEEQYLKTKKYYSYERIINDHICLYKKLI